jgi:hypothetical protein
MISPVRLVCPPRRAKEVAVYSPSMKPATVLESCRPFVAGAGFSVQTENVGFAPVSKSATDLLVPVELAASLRTEQAPRYEYEKQIGSKELFFDWLFE